MVLSTRDLRRRLSEVLDRAAGGEEIVVTRRGEPVARLVPLPGEERLPDLADLRASIRVRGRPLSEEVVSAREDERY